MQEEKIFLTALFIAVIMILPAEYASSRGVLRGNAQSEATLPAVEPVDSNGEIAAESMEMGNRLPDSVMKRVSMIQNERAFRMLGERTRRDKGNFCLQTLGMFGLEAQEAMLGPEEVCQEWLRDIGADTLGLTLSDIASYCRQAWTPRPEDKGASCRVSNSLWRVERGAQGERCVQGESDEIASAKLEELRKAFGTELFHENPTTCGGLISIDTWIDSVSGNRIPFGLQESETFPEMLVSITDFRGELKYPFSKILEFDWTGSSFRNLSRYAVETFTMCTTAPLSVGWLPGCDLLRFPYKGGRYSLCLIIPTKATFLETVENLSRMEWDEMKKEMHEELLDVRMVPFASKSKSYNIPSVTPSTEADENLPMEEDCVSEDHYKMNPLNAVSMGYYSFGWNGTDRLPFFVGEVAGIAKPITIKEMKKLEKELAKSVRPPRFKVQKPFLFFLTDDVTGSIVLVGQVTNLKDYYNDWLNVERHHITNEF